MKHIPLQHHGDRAMLLLVVAATVLLCSSLGFAAEGAHAADGAAQLKDFLYRLFNFAILAGILFWAVKKANIGGLLAARRDDVAKTLQEAVQLRETAEQKLAEYTDKLTRATREIEDIQAAILHEGELERQRIIAEAESMAAKIREQAAVAARQELQQARDRLRADAALLAVQLAEATLRESVTPMDQDRFVDDYLAKLLEAP